MRLNFQTTRLKIRHIYEELMICPKCQKDTDMLKFTTTGVMCRCCHASERTAVSCIAVAGESTCSAYGRALIDGTEIKPAFDSLEDCRAQGQAAADQAYKRNQNPYQEGTQRREWWDAGWCESGEELCGER